MMPSYKLIYFNGKGRAECLRLLFKLKGVEFEDKRVEIADWASVKPTLPFGQAPVLEVDGKQLPQGKAIARYLAREFDLLGKDSWGQAIGDAVVEAITDLSKLFWEFYMVKDADKKAKESKKFAENVAPGHLSNIEKFLTGNVFLTGDDVSMFDIDLAVQLEFMVGLIPDILTPYPKLLALYNRVNAIPQLAEWIAKRPDTPF
ncbi:unnamed protein product [Owenia fusiformis]|uniref:Uncharacterized protein n=1 Tax=Owenia fusiformis TaxID=6347 RepID=A0A8J1UAN8_OWEFU|nr:unnamed protein product [Owenia fusiformis]